MEKKRLALVGCGNLGGVICRGFDLYLREHYDFVGVCDPDEGRRSAAAALTGGRAVATAAELAPLRADYVVEATSPALCREMAIPLLQAGSNLIVLSTGAFADDDFRREARAQARRAGVKIHLASGAIGGLDLMEAARLMGPLEAAIVNDKPPEALNGAPFLRGRTLSPTEEELLFSGSAREAIREFPHNVNVAVTLALLTAGLDDTRVDIRSVPGLVNNSHCIQLSGVFGKATLLVESAPSAGNAKSSELAAWSVVALLNRLQSEWGL